MHPLYNNNHSVRVHSNNTFKFTCILKIDQINKHIFARPMFTKSKRSYLYLQDNMDV